MPIVVNTNVASINAQRSLNLINRSMDRSLERLASGLRINRAGDDAAGLAIADGLQSQVRGLTQAVRNASDGLSIAGMAEGALTTQVTILQRIRELAIQAANDTNSATNRQAIQDEIDAQVSELTRLGNTTEFNGLSLLNGTFANKQIQVGAFANQTINITLGDFRASHMGQIATATSANAVDANAIAGGGDVTINGVNVGASTSDGVSSVTPSASALAKATAINAVSSQTGVTATAEATSVQGSAAITGGSVLVAHSMTINGVSIFSGEAFTTLAGDSDGLLRNKINAKSNQTGVVASVTATNFLVLTAADGRNIDVAVSGATVAMVGIATGTTRSKVTLTSASDFSVGGSATARIGFAAAFTQGVDPNKAVNKINVSTQAGATTGIQIVDAALNKVAAAQGQLGALTNRLENTIANIEISIENLSASESRIRDADFAKETANLTRAQIIQQAGVAVLTQANLKPQAALALIGV